LRKLLVLIFALATSACASLTTDSTQAVSVNSEPPGANCRVTGSNGFVTSLTTPGTVTATKGNGDLSIACTKGSLAGSGTLEEGVAGMVFGNILFGGIIGVGIDAATGKMWKYPAGITVGLTDSGAPPAAPPAATPPPASRPTGATQEPGKPTS